MALVDFYLKIDGIDGESTDDKHKDQIDVLSWSWGESNAGSFSTGGGGGSGKVAMQDFHFTQLINKASPKLFLACASGQHIKSAVLSCCKAGTTQQEFLKITFSDILISSYQTGGAQTADVRPSEQISFNFAKIEFEYSPQKSDGSLAAAMKSGWDLKANKKA